MGLSLPEVPGLNPVRGEIFRVQSDSPVPSAPLHDTFTSLCAALRVVGLNFSTSVNSMLERETLRFFSNYVALSLCLFSFLRLVSSSSPPSFLLFPSCFLLFPPSPPFPTLFYFPPCFLFFSLFPLFLLISLLPLFLFPLFPFTPVPRCQTEKLKTLLLQQLLPSPVNPSKHVQVRRHLQPPSLVSGLPD